MSLVVGKEVIHTSGTWKENFTRLEQSDSGHVYDGIASGFGNTQFLYFPQNLPLKSCTSFEMVAKVKYVSNGAIQAIFTENNVGYEGKMSFSASGTVRLTLDTNHADSYGICNISGTTTLTDGEIYWVKAEWTGSAYNIYLSTDGETWNLEGTKTTTTKPNYTMQWNIGSRNKSSYYVFPSEIYLKDCYININGERFWDYSKGVKFSGNWLYYEEDNHIYTCGGRNCFVIPKIFQTNGKSWEIKTKIKTDDLTNADDRAIIGSMSSADYQIPVIFIVSGKLSFYLSSNGTSWDIAKDLQGTSTLEANTEYYIKAGWNGSNYYIDYSLDDIDYINALTLASTTPIYNPTNNLVALGNNLYTSTSTLANLQQLIYLEDTEIYIDNELWWNCWYNEDYTNICEYNLFHDEKLIHQKDEWKENFKKHIVSGSCIIEDGVAYNFSTTNRMSPFGGKNNFNPSTTPWEWLFVIEPMILNTDQFVAKIDINYGTSILLSASNNIVFNIASGTSSYNIGTIHSLNTVELNKKYWIKAVYTGTQYELYISENGIEFELQGTIVKSTAIKSGDLRFGTQNSGVSNVSSTYFRSKFYIKESYIKVNNEIWWSYDTHGIRYQGTVFNYDSINHTYSCSGNNGLVVPKLFHTNGKPWYIKVKFKTDDLSITTNRNLIGCVNNDMKVPYIILLPDRFKFYLTSNGSSWDIANGIEYQSLNVSIEPYTEYTTILAWDGYRYTFTVKKGNSQETVDIETSTTPIYNSNDLMILGNNLAIESRSLQTDIYLEDTEIYIDDELWWNCRYQQDSYVKQLYNFATKKVVTKKSEIINENLTLVGNLFNKQGKIRGFGESSYIQIPSDYLTELFTNGTGNRGMVVKFKTPFVLPTDISGSQYISNSLELTHNGLYYSTSATTGTSLSVQPNTYYWIKYGGFAVDGSSLKYNYQISIDGINWIGDLNSAYYSIYTDNFIIGALSSNTSKYIFKGAVDLCESYFLDNNSIKTYFANPKNIYYNTYY